MPVADSASETRLAGGHDLLAEVGHEVQLLRLDPRASAPTAARPPATRPWRPVCRRARAKLRHAIGRHRGQAARFRQHWAQRFSSMRPSQALATMQQHRRRACTAATARALSRRREGPTAPPAEVRKAPTRSSRSAGERYRDDCRGSAPRNLVRPSSISCAASSPTSAQLLG